jgi:hypothetical protein
MRSQKSILRSAVKYFLLWIKQDPLRTKICLLVLLIHGVALCWILISNPQHLKSSKKHLVIKTIASPNKSLLASKATTSKNIPNPEKSISRPHEKSLPSKQEAKKTAPSKPKTASSPKKEPSITEKKMNKGKKSAPSTKPERQNKQEISQKLIEELEESIAKLEEQPSKAPMAKKTLPRHSLEKLQVDPTENHANLGSSPIPGDYQQILIEYLHQSLNLPDFGEVKIQITLKNDGTLVNLVVIKAESDKNRKYLEKNLPHLKFPPLEGQASNLKQQTYIVTFCNEI